LLVIFLCQPGVRKQVRVQGQLRLG
jgi:hypothetical protein